MEYDDLESSISKVKINLPEREVNAKVNGKSIQLLASKNYPLQYSYSGYVVYTVKKGNQITIKRINLEFVIDILNMKFTFKNFIPNRVNLPHQNFDWDSSTDIYLWYSILAETIQETIQSIKKGELKNIIPTHDYTSEGKINGSLNYSREDNDLVFQLVYQDQMKLNSLEFLIQLESCLTLLADSTYQSIMNEG